MGTPCNGPKTSFFITNCSAFFASFLASSNPKYISAFRLGFLSSINFIVCSINSTGDISLFFIEDISSAADRYFKLPNNDIKTVNTLDISQWEFFVLPTKVLDQDDSGTKKE
jgi:hypothetical protein